MNSLAKGRLPISRTHLVRFLGKVESLARVGISEQAIGALVSAMPFINSCRLQSTLGIVELLQ